MKNLIRYNELYFFRNKGIYETPGLLAEIVTLSQTQVLNCVSEKNTFYNRKFVPLNFRVFNKIGRFRISSGYE